MSENLRILYNNAADRSTISTSSTAGSLVPANMQKDRKAETWRSTSTSATVTLTWTNSEIVSMLATPFCNLSSTATFRVRCYTNVGDASPILDTGVQLACPYTPLGMWDWGNLPLGVNAYSYGGAAYGVIYFQANAIKKLVLDIVDTSNPSGYIEMSRMVSGAYWSPANNAELDPKLEVMESATHERNDAGDLFTDIGYISKKIEFSLAVMTSADKNSVMNILRGNGMARPVFLSLMPANEDSSTEQHYQIYGKLSNQATIGLPNWNLYNTTIQIEEV